MKMLNTVELLKSKNGGIKVSEITNVEPQDPTKKNSPVEEKGAEICSGGVRLVCNGGTWRYLATFDYRDALRI
jgi:hypothetical protein